MTLRISMWSGPRNISTTMMRAFENRPDCAVIDEPFYGAYLTASGADHPYREETLRAQSADWRAVRAELMKAPAGGEPILFAKHIAYHYPDDEPLDFLRDHRSFILIRDPRRMVASYAKKFAEVAPIVDSFRVCRRIDAFCAKARLPCPVVDAADILADPPGMLEKLCKALDILFTDKMLSWPSGPRASDGPWAPHWYDAVNASTGFKQSVEAPLELEPALERLAALAAPDYRYFRDRRLR